LTYIKRLIGVWKYFMRTTKGCHRSNDGEAQMNQSSESTNATHAAAEAGPLLDMIAESDVGRSLHHSDHLYLEVTTRRALDTAPSGQALHWCNPDTGNYGTIVVHAADTTGGDAPCRHIEQIVTVGGRTRQAYGAARRRPDGSWRLGPIG
jgi:surface antigen